MFNFTAFRGSVWQRVKNRIVPRATALSKSRETTPATAVNEPGLGSSADDEGEESIDRSLDRTGAPMYLGEYKSSLERGEQSGGEVVRVDVR